MFLKVDYLLRANDRHCLMQNEIDNAFGEFGVI